MSPLANPQYEAFLRSKAHQESSAGLSIEAGDLHSSLFDYQRDVTAWLLNQGRGAAFLDTGLGKTAIQCEWARHIPGKVIILAPLAVAQQTVREAAELLGLEITYSKDGRPKSRITITNYERLEAFNPAEFAGVVLDESSILKSFMGKTKKLLCDAFAQTPHRLACTATPAPNDYMELGNHSEFLGVMPNQEMLMRWFMHDSGNTSQWRLKRHGERAFWQWVASWAACLSSPSDAGYDGSRHQLPPLQTQVHSVSSDLDIDGAGEGELFRMPTASAASLHQEKRTSLDARVAVAAELANSTSEPVAVWCETNEESARLAKAIPDAVEVVGSQSPEEKERRLLAFTDGQARVIVSKASICGFGMNWQHCNTVIFASLSYSYEQFYQAIRRFWRFGQTRPVTVHVVLADSEIPVWQTIQRKLDAHEEMKGAMKHAAFSRGQHSSIKISYQPTHTASLPDWLFAA